MTRTTPISVLVLGASYGLLPAVRIALAGHTVTVVCRRDEGRAIAEAGAKINMPERGGATNFVLCCPAHIGPGRVGSIGCVTPQDVPLQFSEFVILAMQEPQLQSPEIRALMQRIAKARIPLLSLQNMPPPPFLQRVGLEPGTVADAYTDLDVWQGFDPGLFSLASPDAQAVRKDTAKPGSLTVTLATNFKAAPFADEIAQKRLRDLAADVDRSRPEDRHPSVRLVASPFLHAPLAKWPMLICGNCRCLRDGQPPVSIAQAVRSDLDASRAIYDWVTSVVRKTGAPSKALVPFDRYAEAAAGLTLPSSLARGLANGAVAVERIDLLLAAVASAQGMDQSPLAPITDLIEHQLRSNGLNAVA